MTDGCRGQSTVMLAVDVSFLAVPGVDPAMQAFQPVGVIATYISVMCTIGSLFSSIILINQSRTSARSSSAEVVSMLYVPLVQQCSSCLASTWLVNTHTVRTHDKNDFIISWHRLFGNHVQRAAWLADVGVCP